MGRDPKGSGNMATIHLTDEQSFQIFRETGIDPDRVRSGSLTVEETNKLIRAVQEMLFSSRRESH
jgi:hypothetical protein